MNEQPGTDDSQFEKDVRVDLTLDLLGRADKAGETIRALLFAGIGASLALLLDEPTPSPGFFHVLAVLAMLGAGGGIIYSWHIQKKKAIKRFKAVLKNGVAGYRAVQRNWNQNKWKWSNSRYDLIAAGLFGFGILSEGIARALGSFTG